MQGTLQLAEPPALPPCGDGLLTSLAWRKAEALLDEFFRMFMLAYLCVLCVSVYLHSD